MSILTAIYLPPVTPLRAGALGGLASQHPDEHPLNPMSGQRRCFAADPLWNFERDAFFFFFFPPAPCHLSASQLFQGWSLGGVCTAPVSDEGPEPSCRNQLETGITNPGDFSSGNAKSLTVRQLILQPISVAERAL